MRVIVAGALANKPGNGGEAWVRLTWALGLRRLGCEVVLAEQLPDAACTDAAGGPAPFAESVNRAWFDALVERFGLAGAACLVRTEGRETSGLPFDALVAFAERAQLLVNLSGHLTLAPVFERVASRLYVDLDPGYTQLWAAAGDPGARVAGHDAFATVGLNVGDPACPLPTGGVPWRPVRPPVLLDAWPASPPPAGGAFTTVATWRNPLGTIAWEGRTYASKAHAFRELLSLPARAGDRFEVALDIHPADARDRDALLAHGWSLADPRAVAGEPESFRAYVRGSLAECSPAQPLYAETRSGWLGDRTAHYLASGRPALVQDTGLAMSGLPTGEGLLTFRTLDEAAAGARAIAAEPERHGRAARALAQRWLDSDVVLGALLDGLGLPPPATARPAGAAA
jgi:hypothetical protein